MHAGIYAHYTASNGKCSSVQLLVLEAGHRPGCFTCIISLNLTTSVWGRINDLLSFWIENETVASSFARGRWSLVLRQRLVSWCTFLDHLFLYISSSGSGRARNQIQVCRTPSSIHFTLINALSTCGSYEESSDPRCPQPSKPLLPPQLEFPLGIFVATQLGEPISISFPIAFWRYPFLKPMGGMESLVFKL